jgi:transposase-like protein
MENVKLFAQYHGKHYLPVGTGHLQILCQKGIFTILYLSLMCYLIINGLFFQNSHVPIRSWLKVIYYFCLDAQLYQIQKYVQNVSRKTLIKMLMMLRMLCNNELDKLKEGIIFGENVECNSNVEIDESAFGKKRKNNRGKRYKKQWVFGITEKRTNKVILEIVSNRSKATLLPIICKHISKEAIIHHDDWAAYRKLSNLGYKHVVVNHSKEFKASNGACTNTIEGIWGVIKQRIARMHGIDPSKLQTYLSEFSYRYYWKDQMLREMLRSLSV